METERLEILVARAGLPGAALIVKLISVAVLAGPIPNSSIALAAGRRPRRPS